MTIHDQIRKLALQYDLHWSDQKLLEFALDYIEDVAETEGFIRHLRTNTEAAGGTLAVDEGVEREKDFTVAPVDIPVITTRNIVRRKKSLANPERMLDVQSRLSSLTPEQQVVVFSKNAPEASGYTPYARDSRDNRLAADDVVLLKLDSEPIPAIVEPTVVEIDHEAVARMIARFKKK